MMDGYLIILIFFFLIPFTVRYGQGTRDMAGPSGLTTEAFISKVRQAKGHFMSLM